MAVGSLSQRVWFLNGPLFRRLSLRPLHPHYIYLFLMLVTLPPARNCVCHRRQCRTRWSGSCVGVTTHSRRHSLATPSTQPISVSERPRGGDHVHITDAPVRCTASNLAHVRSHSCCLVKMLEIYYLFNRHN